MLKLLIFSLLLFFPCNSKALEFEFGNYGTFYAPDDDKYVEFYSLIASSYFARYSCNGSIDSVSAGEFAKLNLNIGKKSWNHFLRLMARNQFDIDVLKSKDGGFSALIYLKFREKLNESTLQKESCPNYISDLNREWEIYTKIYGSTTSPIDVLFLPYYRTTTKSYPFNRHERDVWIAKKAQIKFAENRCRRYVSSAYGIKSYFFGMASSKSDIEHHYNSISNKFPNNDEGSCEEIVDFINSDGIRIMRLLK